jgi:ATP synthase protein I
MLIGFACGYYLDKWLGTGPWLLLLFTIFGLAAGISNVYRTAGRFLK